ncbi:hypothetical protein DW886_09425 [Enterocloster aldenensis]|nr:hypothetical protein DW886_09425 [Enterocloster aldenensis]
MIRIKIGLDKIGPDKNRPHKIGPDKNRPYKNGQDPRPWTQAVMQECRVLSIFMYFPKDRSGQDIPACNQALGIV